MKKKSQVAVVTGAGQGIGAAIAKALIKNGYTVAALDIDLKKAQSIVKSSRNSSKAYPCDVSDSETVAATLKQIQKDLGEVSVLINNAGVGGPFHLLNEVSDSEWEWIFKTNVKSVFNFCRVLLPQMKKKNFGRIVNIASIQGLLGASRSSTYVATKHAMIGYTRSIASEWGAYGITCNAICPGYVDTQMGIQSKSVQDHRKKVLLRTPSRSIATPDQIAFQVLNFLSTESAYLNGSIVVADGGITADVGIS